MTISIDPEKTYHVRTEYGVERMTGEEVEEYFALRRGEPMHAVDRDAVEAKKSDLRTAEVARAELAEEKEGRSARAWRGVSGDVFDPTSPEPEPEVLEYAPGRFAFAPGVTWLYGPVGSLKSWIAYEAIAQTLRSNECEDSCRALVLDYEMTYEEAVRRLILLGCHDRSQFTYVKPPGPLTDIGRKALVRRFEDQHPFVVVIDTAGMAMGYSGLDSNSDTASAQWALEVPLWMKAQWRETVIIVLDHTPKAGGSDPIGSQRKGAVADFMCHVQLLSPISRMTRGRGRATVQKDRDGFYDKGATLFEFEFGGGGPFLLFAPEGDGAAAPAAESMLTRIARFVGDNEGVKVEAARAALGIQAADFTRHKSTLVDFGAVIHVPRRGLFKGPNWRTFVTADHG